jgi:hypothetical protein
MRYQDDAFRREPFMNGTTVATLLFIHNGTSGFRQRWARRRMPIPYRDS